MKTYGTLLEKMNAMKLDQCVVKCEHEVFHHDGSEHGRLIINKTFEDTLDANIDINYLSYCAQEGLRNIYMIDLKGKHVDPREHVFVSVHTAFHSNARDRSANYDISIVGLGNNFGGIGDYQYRQDLFDYDSDGVLLGMSDDSFAFLCSRLVSEQFLTPFADIVDGYKAAPRTHIPLKVTKSQEIIKNITSL